MADLTIDNADVLALDSGIREPHSALADSATLQAELGAAIAAFREAMRSQAPPSPTHRPASTCAASFSISIANIPVAQCRAMGRTDSSGHGQMCFTTQSQGAKGASRRRAP
jgi:hypothetical protein